jgi:antitoxin component of MazEF toxin-antitoxin module
VHECYSGRFWKVGGTWGVVLPPDIRKYFRLTPGELMLMAVDETQGVIVMRPAKARMVYDAVRGLHVPGPNVQVPRDA